jgi:hypothetical protein
VTAAHERDEHMLDQRFMADDRPRHFAFQFSERSARAPDALLDVFDRLGVRHFVFSRERK